MPEKLNWQVPATAPEQHTKGVPGAVHKALSNDTLRVPMRAPALSYHLRPERKISTKPVPGPFDNPAAAPKPVRSSRSIGMVTATWSSSELTDTPAGPVPEPNRVLVPLTTGKARRPVPYPRQMSRRCRRTRRHSSSTVTLSFSTAPL